MGTQDVVIPSPLLNDLSGFRKAREQVRIQAFFAELPIEAFDETVIRRLPWPDELQLDTVRMSPAIQSFAGKFRTVVHANGLGAFPLEPQRFQHPGYTFPRYGSIRLQARTSPVPEVHHRQHPDAAAVVQAVAHEIHGPMLIRLRGARRHHAQMARAFATSPEP